MIHLYAGKCIQETNFVRVRQFNAIHCERECRRELEVFYFSRELVSQHPAYYTLVYKIHFIEDNAKSSLLFLASGRVDLVSSLDCDRPDMSCLL